MISLGSEPTNSVKTRAGMVMDPSFSILAPIQQLMAISRLVAASLSCDSSVDISTFWVIGRVVLDATALPMMPRPLLRFSCRHDSFIDFPPLQ